MKPAWFSSHNGRFSYHRNRVKRAFTNLPPQLPKAWLTRMRYLPWKAVCNLLKSSKMETFHLPENLLSALRKVFLMFNLSSHLSKLPSNWRTDFWKGEGKWSCYIYLQNRCKNLFVPLAELMRSGTSLQKLAPLTRRCHIIQCTLYRYKMI